jgi:hypothetical protein
MENAIWRIAFHMECSPPSLRLNRRFKLRVNMKFCQSYPKNLKDMWHRNPEPGVEYFLLN